MAETEEVAPEVTLPELPYNKEVLTEINKFFKGRSKYPGNYVYTADGDLEIIEGVGRGKKKIEAGNILLQRFVPLDPAERALLEETRLDQLSALDQEFEEEIKALQVAWEEYRTTESMRAVLNSNQRLAEIDARRSAVRAQVRDLVYINNPSINTILLSDRYEERKMFSQNDIYDKAFVKAFNAEVVRMAFYTYPAEVEQGKYVPDGVAPVKEEPEETANELEYRQRLKDGRYARIFFDTDSDVNGFMSPMWPVDFTMASAGGDARYSSPIQAYEVERAKDLGDAKLAESLMKTRSARTIRLLTRQIKGHPKDARGLWLKIYTAVYETYPTMKAKLLATGSDTLVFADSREGPSSIGLAEKERGVLDPALWKGENAVGLAQETVRTRSREGTQGEAPQATEVANAVITEEEQAKAKVGAIINANRRGGRR
jgi:predicted NAD-dependent protein-ADP-ribosyltransferase YbiA (DUF1768 family)